MQARNIDVSKLISLDGWNQFWSDNFVPWHKDSVNPKLEAHLGTVVASCGKSKTDSIRFLVPLCGKTVDLIYLYKKGFQVIGVEGVEKGCLEFFTENDLQFKKTVVQPGFSMFETEDGRLKIFNCNFFDLTPEILGGKIDCVWDRGSFVAVDLTQRQQYANTMSKLLADKFGYILASIERQFEPRDVMPHSVSFADAAEFFGPFCHVKLLEQSILPGDGDSGSIKDNAFLFTHKEVESNEHELNYWQGRWAKGDAQWHHAKPNEYLVKYLDVLKAGKDSIRIFLPLCGKTLDLVWLYKQGHEVVGLEGTPFVAEMVFQEAKLEYSKYFLPEIDGFVFRTPDEKLTIFSCDFFAMKPEIIGKFDAVFDRGAFEAIVKENEVAYVDFMLQILEKKFRYILNGYEYQSEEFKGPPRNIPKENVFKLFQRKTASGSTGVVKIVEEADYVDHGREKFHVENMIKFIYLIQNEE